MGRLAYPALLVLLLATAAAVGSRSTPPVELRVDNSRSEWRRTWAANLVQNHRINELVDVMRTHWPTAQVTNETELIRMTADEFRAVVESVAQEPLPGAP